MIKIKRRVENLKRFFLKAAKTRTGRDVKEPRGTSMNEKYRNKIGKFNRYLKWHVRIKSSSSIPVENVTQRDKEMENVKQIKNTVDKVEISTHI